MVELVKRDEDDDREWGVTFSGSEKGLKIAREDMEE